MSGNLSQTTYPISTGTYGLTKVFKIQFNGSFSHVWGVKIYKSAGSYVTGEVINFGTSTTFSVPTGGSYPDTVATTAIAASLLATYNVPIGGSLLGTITTAGDMTDYVFLQSSVSIQATSQAANQKTFVVDYNFD